MGSRGDRQAKNAAYRTLRHAWKTQALGAVRYQQMRARR